MDTGLNEGIANTLVVRAESSLAGSLTGSTYAFDGRIAFSTEPVLGGNVPKRNVWRAQDGDSYSARSYRATIDMEWSHGELTALLLASLFRRTGTTPNYTFKPGGLSLKQSLAIGFGYVPNGLEFVLRGAIVESMQVALRPREVSRVRFGIVAAKLTTDGPIAAVTAGNIFRVKGDATAEYDSIPNPRVYDFSLEAVQRINFANFGEDGTPTDYAPEKFDVSIDLAEWMANTGPEGDQIAGDVRNQNEVTLLVSTVPAPGKLLTFTIPRMINRSGTPPLLSPGGIGYRASAEAQSSVSRTDLTSITMSI